MLWVVLNEAVIRRQVGGTAVMGGQLDRLSVSALDTAASTDLVDEVREEGT